MLNAESLRTKYSKLQNTSSTICKAPSSVNTTPVLNEPTIFPFSMVKDSLEQHPIHFFFKADLFETFKCMSNMLSSLLNSSPDDKSGNTMAPERVRTNDICEHCSSVCFLDSMHAEVTCTNCGIVAQSRFSLHENFERRKDLKNAAHIGASTMFASQSDCKDPEHWSEIDELIEHCNPYVNLSYDAIRLAKFYQRKINIRSNSLSKAFASIAMVQLKDRVDWSYVTRAVEMKAPVPQVSIMKFKKPQYSCLKCGAPVEEAYMRRRHPCKWGKISKKNTRRSVWNRRV